MNCDLCNVTVQNIIQHNKSVTHQKMKHARHDGIDIGIASQRKVISNLEKQVKQCQKDTIISKIFISQVLQDTYVNILTIIEEHSGIDLNDLDIVRQNNNKQEIVCSICLDKINRKEQMVRTKCNHRFHPFCYIKWAHVQKNKEIPCPICRTITDTKSVDSDLIKKIQTELQDILS